jgi:hypothetical protein
MGAGFVLVPKKINDDKQQTTSTVTNRRKRVWRADLQVINQLITDDWIEHQFNLKGGKEVLKNAILSLAAAFTDRKYTQTNYAVNDDIVCNLDFFQLLPENHHLKNLH